MQKTTKQDQNKESMAFWVDYSEYAVFDVMFSWFSSKARHIQ